MNKTTDSEKLMYARGILDDWFKNAFRGKGIEKRFGDYFYHLDNVIKRNARVVVNEGVFTELHDETLVESLFKTIDGIRKETIKKN